jgi:hypothetical protein
VRSPPAPPRGTRACRCFLLELRVDLDERALADLAGAARRELPVLLPSSDVAGFFEDLENFSCSMASRASGPSRSSSLSTSMSSMSPPYWVRSSWRSTSSMDCIWSMSCMPPDSRSMDPRRRGRGTGCAGRAWGAGTRGSGRARSGRLQLRVADLVGEQVLELLAHVAGSESSSDCIWPIWCCICATSSSSDCGGLSPNRSPYLSMNWSKSGSLPAMRSCSIWFRSRTMSFMRCMSSGDMLAICWYMSLKKVSIMAFFRTRAVR